MHGLSQAEIATVLSVRADQVKAYIFQARSNLLSERHARETDCREIREELATARGASLLRGRLRRHLRSCQDCRVYADGVARQRRQLGAVLPLAPSLVLKYQVLRHVLESGFGEQAPYAGGAAMTGSVVGAAVEFAGGGVKAVAIKVATGAACICASVGMGASVLGTGPDGPVDQGARNLAASPTAEAAARRGRRIDRARRLGGPRPNDQRRTELGDGGRLDKRAIGADGQDGEPPAASSEQPPARIARPRCRSATERRATKRSAKATTSSSVEAERQSEREANRQERERGQREHEEEARSNQEERQLAREEKQRKHEEREHVREERQQRVGDSHPPRSEEELQRNREARQLASRRKAPRRRFASAAH